MSFSSYLIKHPIAGAVHGAGAVMRRAIGRNALKDQLPWMPWPAIEFLGETLRTDMRVFEYGSGGSTLFLAKRTSKVITVEHDRGWGERVREELQALSIENVDLRIVEPEDGGEGFSSDVGVYSGKSFKRYAEQISEFSDATFDVVIVDGRARNDCLRLAAPKIKRGGMLILDNSEREKYRQGVQVLKEYNPKRFYGLNPYQLYPGETTVWTIR